MYRIVEKFARLKVRDFCESAKFVTFFTLQNGTRLLLNEIANFNCNILDFDEITMFSSAKF